MLGLLGELAGDGEAVMGCGGDVIKSCFRALESENLAFFVFTQ
jgi:hypothetical protein